MEEDDDRDKGAVDTRARSQPSSICRSASSATSISSLVSSRLKFESSLQRPTQQVHFRISSQLRPLTYGSAFAQVRSSHVSLLTKPISTTGVHICMPEIGLETDSGTASSNMIGLYARCISRTTKSKRKCSRLLFSPNVSSLFSHSGFLHQICPSQLESFIKTRMNIEKDKIDRLLDWEFVSVMLV